MNLSLARVFLCVLWIGCRPVLGRSANAFQKDVQIINNNDKDYKKIVVIAGAGPAGLLLAHYLLGRHANYELHIFEKRPDPRNAPPSEQRTYPISLQQKRGVVAIREISPSLFEAVEAAGAWLKRAHFRQGDETSSKKRFRSPMLSLDRNGLALVLLQHLVQHVIPTNTQQGNSCYLHFGTSVEDLNLVTNTVTLSNGKLMKFDHLVAADGSRSMVRQRLTEQGRLSSTIEVISVENKSFNVPRKSQDRSFQVDDASFNGWALKNGAQALALPLGKDACSGAMSFPQNCDPFQNMKTPEQVLEFFQQSAPHTLAKLVTMEEAKSLLKRPITRLYTVKCKQLHVDEKVLLLGDAAHATSNVLGQGANAALQDVQVFCGILRDYKDDWRQALYAYTTKRLPCIQAVQEMSEYTVPPNPQMRKEFRQRQKVRQFFGPWFGSTIVGHDAMQLLADTSLSYSQVYRKTRWWSDRVKNAWDTM
eukprot:scaffold34597_cov177-Amphora_coffeaeformis.AAC.18